MPSNTPQTTATQRRLLTRKLPTGEIAFATTIATQRNGQAHILMAKYEVRANHSHDGFIAPPE